MTTPRRAFPTLLILLLSVPASPPAACLGKVLDVERTTRFPRNDYRESRGGPNAPVRVRDGVLFRISAPDAEAVSLVGEFNGWDPGTHRLRRTRDGVWRAVVDLEPGRWRYLFVVDGEWSLDPDNPIVRDGPAANAAETSALLLDDDEVVLPRAHGKHEASGSLSVSYQRVDQVTAWGGLAYENRTDLHPRIDLAGGWSFGRKRGLYRIGLVQPIVDVDLLDVGATVYRITDTPDSARFGDTENSLATFFFRQDWRDYHEAEGVTAHATAYFGRALDVTLRWRGEDHSSLDKTTDWGLFGGATKMRDNPAVDDGTLRTLRLELRWDTRNDPGNPTRGFLVTARRDWAGRGLGGDFDYRKSTLDFRRYAKLSRGHFFDLRVAGGTVDDAERGEGDDALIGFEAIPEPEKLFLGGLGTMRATQFKSLAGDRMLLVNAEVRVEIFPNLQLAVFGDVGDAWVAEERRPDMKVDAGVGLQNPDGSFRVNLARKLDRDDASLHVTARLQRMF